MEDEDFGEDVLYGSLVKKTPKKQEVQPQQENAAERVDDGDEALYGGVGKAVALTEQEEKGPNEAKGSDEEDDDDEIAIVLNDSKPAARATLRFTHGTNRYVRPGTEAEHEGESSPTLASLKSQMPSTDIPLGDLILPGGRKTAFDVEIEDLEEKPWRKPGVDISDYFNYGFDESSWLVYAAKQNQIRREMAIAKAHDQAAKKAAMDSIKEPPVENRPNQSAPPVNNAWAGQPPPGPAWSGQGGPPQGFPPPWNNGNWPPRGPPPQRGAYGEEMPSDDRHKRSSRDDRNRGRDRRDHRDRDRDHRDRDRRPRDRSRERGSGRSRDRSRDRDRRERSRDRSRDGDRDRKRRRR